MSIEDHLHDLGCIVVGPALTVAQAEALAASEPIDAAVLDINLGDSPSFVVAQILRGRSIPFCFATGYGTGGVPADFERSPVLSKPYGEAALAAILARLIV